MKIERGSFSLAATGNTTVLFNDSTITADKITFSLGPAGSSDSVCHSSDGLATPTQQCCKSIYADTTGAKSQQTFSKCITHLTRVSGTITEIISATRQSLATTGQFTLNATAVNASYTIFFVAEEY